MKKNSIKLIISIISIILIVSVLCGKIVKADTAPNFENIDALKAAGRNGKVKIGDTVKFEENVSSGRTDYFCYEHGEGEFKYGNYTINDIIEINGSKAKSYNNNSTVVASTENALMSYIFSGGNYSKSHLIKVTENGEEKLYVTGRNIAIWAYQNIWQNKLRKRFF